MNDQGNTPGSAVEHAQTLVRQPEWIGAVCDCSNNAAKRMTLLACSKAMLPYWESRFPCDESMSQLVDLMERAVISPTAKNHADLSQGIPRQLRRQWSPIFEILDESRSDCSGDFAGDSIFYAACAFVEMEANGDVESALECAVECIARMLGERHIDDDDNSDLYGLAVDRLRRAIQQILS